MKCVSYALTLTGGCADDRILQAEKAVKRAEAQQERAGKAQEWCLAKLESAQARLEPALDDPECMSDARFSQLSHMSWMTLYNKCRPKAIPMSRKEKQLCVSKVHFVAMLCSLGIAW